MGTGRLMPRYLEDADVVAARVKRFAERIEPGVDVSEFPTSVTTPRVVEEMPKSVAAKIKRFGEVIEPGVPVSEYPTSILGQVSDKPDDKPDDPLMTLLMTLLMNQLMNQLFILKQELY
jgi:hypothetical protein